VCVSKHAITSNASLSIPTHSRQLTQSLDTHINPTTTMSDTERYERELDPLKDLALDLESQLFDLKKQGEDYRKCLAAAKQ